MVYVSITYYQMVQKKFVYVCREHGANNTANRVKG